MPTAALRRTGVLPDMPAKIIIPGTLPNLNDYIAAERRNKHIAAALKRQTEHTVMLYAKSQLHGLRFTYPVRMSYTWYEPNRRRDKDNVSSFGRKCIQDALVRAGILQNDGWAEIDSFSDTFAVDKNHPRIEVEIQEVSPTNRRA